MKKLIYTAGAALVMLASASCKKNETVKEAQPSVEKADMVFTATAAGKSALKTTIADGTKALWIETDKIKVFSDADTQGSECNLTSGAGTNTAEFAGQCDKTGPWTAICPSSAAKSFNNGTITFTMPDKYSFSVIPRFEQGESVIFDNMPCVAYSDNNTLEFNHSFGILKLVINRSNDGSRSLGKNITITDKTPGSKLTGTFTVNPAESPVAVKSGTDGGNSIKIIDVYLYRPITEIYIPVPEGAFANGFDCVIMTNVSDLGEYEEYVTATFSATAPNPIKAGQITVMPEIELSTAIGGMTDGYFYTKLWDGGPNWAVENVGANSMCNYGTYLKWGETTGSTSSVSDGNHKYLDENGKYTKYVYDAETETSDYDYLQPEDDAATVNWGKSWRMPTKAEFQALWNNCNHNWVTNYRNSGVNGMLFTGKGAYAKAIPLFLPAGSFNGSGLGTQCYYWLADFMPKCGPAAICNTGTAVMMTSSGTMTTQGVGRVMPMQVVAVTDNDGTPF